MSEPTRLDKRLVELRGCSRADAQKLIEGGWVSVDGKVVESPQHKVTDERIEVADEAKIEAAEPATMLFHKPPGLRYLDCAAQISPANRSADDGSGWRLLQAHFNHLSARLPLDTEASGLVVLTQDPRVQRRLSEDYPILEQEYVVEVSGHPADDVLQRLARGLEYRNRPLPPCKVSWQNETRLRFALKNVQAGQLQHMCREVKLQAVSIKRIRVGSIPLKKMPPGEWRYLPVEQRF